MNSYETLKNITVYFIEMFNSYNIGDGMSVLFLEHNIFLCFDILNQFIYLMHELLIIIYQTNLCILYDPHISLYFLASFKYGKRHIIHEFLSPFSVSPKPPLNPTLYESSVLTGRVINRPQYDQYS